MSAATTILVSVGLLLALALGLARGFDTTGLILFGLLAVFGALSISAARRARSGGVMPARCSKCGGLVSPNAPYCKHCKEPLGGNA